MNTILLVVALTLSAPALKDKDKPKVGAEIVGMWQVETMSLGGKQPPAALAEMRYEFTADGKWIMHRPTKAGVAGGPLAKSPPAKEYTVEAKAGQKNIDTRITGSDRPGMAGIFKVEGDTLTICFGASGGERPTAFESPDGSRVMLMTLKRVKKEAPGQ